MIFRSHQLMAAACLCASIGLPATAIAQQPGVEFAVEPGSNSQTAEGGGYFLIDGAPGKRVRQSLTLRNESGKSLTLRLAAVDATTGQLGGVSYALPNEPIKTTGTWIELDQTKVGLEGGEARRVGFDVSVPSDATEGEHIAGITVWEVGKEEKGEEAEAVSVVVQTRRVVAVQVDLPGEKVPELVVTGIEPAARPDGLYLEIGLENRGTAMTKGTGTVEIPALDFARDFSVDTFVPKTSIGYPIDWTDEPQEGVFEATVEIDYDDGVAKWEGTFTVGNPVLEDLEDRGVDVPQTFPIVPVAAAALAAAAVGLWALRRRRGRAMPDPPLDDRGGPTPGKKPSEREHDPRVKLPRPRGQAPPPPPPPPPARTG